MPVDEAQIEELGAALAAQAEAEGWTAREFQLRVREAVAGSRGVQPVTPPSAAATPPAAPAAAPVPVDPFAQDPTSQVGMTLQQEMLMDEHRPGWRERLEARERFQAEAERQAEITKRQHEEEAYNELLRTDPHARAKHFAQVDARDLALTYWSKTPQERLEIASRVGGEIEVAGLDVRQVADLESLARQLEDVPAHEREGAWGFELTGALGAPGGQPRYVRLRQGGVAPASITTGIG